MIKVENRFIQNKQYMKHLQEGDIAIIKDSSACYHIVYIYRAHEESKLCAVSLTEKLCHWSNLHQVINTLA